MSTRLRVSYLAGAALTILGSFLPWWVYGDVVAVWVYGIKTSPVPKDYGGVLIVLLSIVVLLMAFLPQRFVKKPTIWNMMPVIALVLCVGYHVVRFLVLLIECWGIIGAPTLRSGMVMIISGSIILLLTSLFHLSVIRRRD